MAQGSESLAPLVPLVEVAVAAELVLVPSACASWEPCAAASSSFVVQACCSLSTAWSVVALAAGAACLLCHGLCREADQSSTALEVPVHCLDSWTSHFGIVALWVYAFCSLIASSMLANLSGLSSSLNRMSRSRFDALVDLLVDGHTSCL